VARFPQAAVGGAVYLVHPRRGQRTKNRLSERILHESNMYPDRVKFPVSRNR